MTQSDRAEAGGDICPQCGTEVAVPVPDATSGAKKGAFPGRPVEIDCPHCGRRLRRAASEAWHLADEADLDEASSAGNDPAGNGPADPDSALDEALEESFPASDPPAL
jgi:rRNA maturation protein Nop10